MKENQILDHMYVADEKKSRPIAITIICVIGFIGAAVAVPLIFVGDLSYIGAWYPPYLGIATIIGFICMIGLWKMKRWAAYTYAAFVVINQVVLLSMDVWSIRALIVPSIVIAIAFYHVDKMD